MSRSLRRAAAAADQCRASCGWTPAVAERPGRARASATARSLSGSVAPMTTTCPTSASRARARTASRSGSNAASPRWQWASTSTSHGRFGADLGATSAARRGWRGERNGARRTERPGATRILARPALLDVHEERRRDIDRREGPREDREGHHQRKRPQHLAREQHERDRRRHGGPVCENGARQRLVDREIQDLVQVLAPELTQVLAYAIEDDDRVVERVADHGQDRADDHDHHLRSRSEEHTSELQSLAYLVCRLLLEKKKNIKSWIGHRREHRSALE